MAIIDGGALNWDHPSDLDATLFAVIGYVDGLDTGGIPVGACTFVQQCRDFSRDIRPLSSPAAADCNIRHRIAFDLASFHPKKKN